MFAIWIGPTKQFCNQLIAQVSIKLNFLLCVHFTHGESKRSHAKLASHLLAKRIANKLSKYDFWNFIPDERMMSCYHQKHKIQMSPFFKNSINIDTVITKHQIDGCQKGFFTLVQFSCRKYQSPFFQLNLHCTNHWQHAVIIWNQAKKICLAKDARVIYIYACWFNIKKTQTKPKIQLCLS